MTAFWQDPITFLRLWLENLLLFWGVPEGWILVIRYTIGAVLLATAALLFVILQLWLERKLIGRLQDRLGPNRVGPWGLLQPIADVLKIFTKEHITPAGADRVPFNLAPVLSVAAALMVWAVIPFSATVFGAELNVGILYLLAVGAIGEIAIILAGWSSNNKYALLGALRTVAQLISYSVPMTLSALVPVMFSGSLNLNAITRAQEVWFLFLAPLPALIFLTASVAEVGRAPFDLPEAESELVAGYSVEYSGLKFGFFYVAEFLKAFTVSLIFAVLFLGGWRGPGAEAYPVLGFVYLFLKSSAVYLLMILLRGTLPRFRIDQVMDLNWKVLTPLALLLLIIIALVDYFLRGALPLVRVLVLLGVNALAYVILDRLLSSRERLRRQPVAQPGRPVARPENLINPSETGVAS
ncbi:MAG: NADH-quinone oxidoreductase subunit NuoH [Thermanaerothrix sp.]|uniref:NADH-quinone oxidoreductase subunit NuoH n=1 Tax=Thermanaerothrix sp. TaxID=2972675 RepID=UPI003C7CAB65